MVGLAQVHQGVGVFGVVLGEEPVGGESVVDTVAEGVAELGLGHPPVEGEGDDELHIVHPGVGGHVEDLFDDELPDVGPLHGGKRQGDVVEGDGQLHARPQQRR